MISSVDQGVRGGGPALAQPPARQCNTEEGDLQAMHLAHLSIGCD